MTGLASSRPCMLFGARLTRRLGPVPVPFGDKPPAPFDDPVLPFSGMDALPGHLVGLEDRAVPADPLISLPSHHHAAQADAHRAAHVLLHRQLDRLARA